MTPLRRRYRTDLTDAQWQVLGSLIPQPKPGGRPAVHHRRELLNAMLYWLRAGCAWRLLPHDLPPWKTVYHYFRCWRLDGRYQTKFNAAGGLDRDGTIRDVIVALDIEDARRPFATAERLAEVGLSEVAARIARHESMANILQDFNSSEGKTTPTP